MTYEQLLSQAADALLLLEEHEEATPEVKAVCAHGRDVAINALIDVRTARSEAA